jgi:hypothetical protein
VGDPSRSRAWRRVSIVLDGPLAPALVPSLWERVETLLEALANAIPRTGRDVHAMVDKLEGLGVDEVIFHPISAELDQFDRLADLVP